MVGTVNYSQKGVSYTFGDSCYYFSCMAGGFHIILRSHSCPYLYTNILIHSFLSTQIVFVSWDFLRSCGVFCVLRMAKDFGPGKGFLLVGLISWLNVPDSYTQRTGWLAG